MQELSTYSKHKRWQTSKIKGDIFKDRRDIFPKKGI